MLPGGRRNMKYCKSCFSELADDALACDKCGAEFEKYKKKHKKELNGCLSAYIIIVALIIICCSCYYYTDKKKAIAFYEEDILHYNCDKIHEDISFSKFNEIYQDIYFDEPTEVTDGLVLVDNKYKMINTGFNSFVIVGGIKNNTDENIDGVTVEFKLSNKSGSIIYGYASDCFFGELEPGKIWAFKAMGIHYRELTYYSLNKISGHRSPETREKAAALKAVEIGEQTADKAIDDIVKRRKEILEFVILALIILTFVGGVVTRNIGERKDKY